MNLEKDLGKCKNDSTFVEKSAIIGFENKEVYQWEKKKIELVIAHPWVKKI